MKWNVGGVYAPGNNFVDFLLELRGFPQESREDFLNPPSVSQLFTDLPPHVKKSLILSRNLIKEAILQNKPIVIHGDYDADGICATTILSNVLKNELDYKKVFAFIPDRFNHGYGLSVASIDYILEKVAAEHPQDKKVLFVTVDSGITSVDEVDYIKSLGHDVIITDHHQKPDPLPNADGILWWDQVVGATLAWLLGRALGSKDPQSICYVALATVTDVQPVFGFNRSVVKTGLEMLNKNPPLGLRSLLDVAGNGDKEITTYQLGWVIGPRLNATGRLETADEALNLLCSQDASTAQILAKKLNQINFERQQKTLQMFKLASTFDLEDTPDIIISEHKDYHEGIIGLVASRLVKKHYRPSIVISLGDSQGKGSVRSVEGIDIISILREFEDLFINVGGHPMAAGFTIALENISALREGLQDYFSKNVSQDLLVPVLDIDLEIPFEELNLELVESLDALKPFGIKNRQPMFVSTNVGISDITLVGKNKRHVSFKFYAQGQYVKGIYFGGAEDEIVATLNVGDRVDVAYTLAVNEFNGSRNVNLFVKALRAVN